MQLYRHVSSLLSSRRQAKSALRSRPVRRWRVNDFGACGMSVLIACGDFHFNFTSSTILKDAMTTLQLARTRNFLHEHDLMRTIRKPHLTPSLQISLAYTLNTPASLIEPVY